MERIMIIGCCGSGKSTLAKKLQTILGLEVFHLDQYYWQPNWIEQPKKEWQKTVQQLAAQEKWIIDGNYTGTLDARLARADTVIYLNYPTIVCLSRVLKRVWTYRGKARPDMNEGCKERLDVAFLHYVLTFKRLKGQKILTKLKGCTDKTVLIFNKDSEAEDYLKSLQK